MKQVHTVVFVADCTKFAVQELNHAFHEKTAITGIIGFNRN